MTRASYLTVPRRASSIDPLAALRIKIVHARGVVTQRELPGARVYRSIQPCRDPRAAVRIQVPVDERIGAERLDQVDLGREHRFGPAARLQVLGADAAQHRLAIAILWVEVHQRPAEAPRDKRGGGPGLDPPPPPPPPLPPTPHPPPPPPPPPSPLP